MQPPFPSPVATWHNDTYPAIDPKRPELSQKGKTVVITGAGSGIGRATALAFALAGASHIALLGRTISTLNATSEEIKSASSTTKISVFTVSVTDERAIHEVAQKIGKWDVLVLNAARLSPPDTILNIPVDEFWESYETNVKSIYIAAQAFIPLANPNASFLGVNAAGAVLPAAVGARLTGYMSSKIAQAKLVEYIAYEHPDLFACSVHPGVVETQMLREAELHESGLPKDTVELPANFMVWLAGRQEKGYLRGKMVWCNWDVGELFEQKEKIEDGGLFTMGMVGWPFSDDQKVESYLGR